MPTDCGDFIDYNLYNLINSNAVIDPEDTKRSFSKAITCLLLKVEIESQN